MENREQDGLKALGKKTEYLTGKALCQAVHHLQAALLLLPFLALWLCIRRSSLLRLSAGSLAFAPR